MESRTSTIGSCRGRFSRESAGEQEESPFAHGLEYNLPMATSSTHQRGVISSLSPSEYTPIAGISYDDRSRRPGTRVHAPSRNGQEFAVAAVELQDNVQSGARRMKRIRLKLKFSAGA